MLSVAAVATDVAGVEGVAASTVAALEDSGVPDGVMTGMVRLDMVLYCRNGSDRTMVVSQKNNRSMFLCCCWEQQMMV